MTSSRRDGFSKFDKVISIWAILSKLFIVATSNGMDPVFCGIYGFGISFSGRRRPGRTLLSKCFTRHCSGFIQEGMESKYRVVLG